MVVPNRYGAASDSSVSRFIVADGPRITTLQRYVNTADLDNVYAAIEQLLAGTDGTAEAYVRTDAEPDIHQATITNVENYVPDHSGSNYVAHVTVGIATLDDLTGIEAGAFEPLTFSADTISRTATVVVPGLMVMGSSCRHLAGESGRVAGRPA